MQLNEILKKPVITEKTTELLKQGYYAFEVDRRANKNQIKEAVEKLFGVEVETVKTLKRKGKTKRRGRRWVEVKLPDKKLAYIKLKKGHIDLFPKV